MDVSENSGLEKLKRGLRLAVFALVIGIVAVTVLVTFFGARKGMSDKQAMLDENGVYVVPHVLRNSYLSSARFDVSCLEAERCQAEAGRICRDAYISLGETRDDAGLWTMVAECEDGKNPQW